MLIHLKAVGMMIYHLLGIAVVLIVFWNIGFVVTDFVNLRLIDNSDWLATLYYILSGIISIMVVTFILALMYMIYTEELDKLRRKQK